MVRRGDAPVKAIIEDRLYDTDKAEEIFTFRRRFQGQELSWMPGYHFASWHETSLYRTQKGSYFEYDKTEGKITVTTKSAAEELVKRLDADKYMELFCASVEEA